MIELFLTIALFCLGVALVFFVKLLFDLKITKRQQGRDVRRLQKIGQEFARGLEEGIKHPDPVKVKQIEMITRERLKAFYENEEDFRIDFIDISRRPDRGNRHAGGNKHKEIR